MSLSVSCLYLLVGVSHPIDTTTTDTSDKMMALGCDSPLRVCLLGQPDSGHLSRDKYIAFMCYFGDSQIKYFAPFVRQIGAPAADRQLGSWLARG